MCISKENEAAIYLLIWKTVQDVVRWKNSIESWLEYANICCVYTYRTMQCQEIFGNTYKKVVTVVSPL